MTRRGLAATFLSSIVAAASGRGFRRPARQGWILVHLEGTPHEIGYQHGDLLAREIEAAHGAVALGLTHDSSHPYGFFREAAQRIFWPWTPREFQLELQGMADAIRARGSKLDLIDLVVLNASLELPYYVNSLEAKRGGGQVMPIAERCSAFVATGSYTRDRGIVAGHNCWSDFLSGAHWKILFDIRPQGGQRFLMDGMAGLIHSGDDFGINAAGLVVTETTISNFQSGFDTSGIPEFVRARQALQYSKSVDEFVRHMSEGNNGGYANNWLVADRSTGEIASLELGFKHVNLDRKKEGYFAGSNFPVNEKLTAEETTFDSKDESSGPLARRTRWQQLMEEHRGTIDVGAAQRFLADHYDVVSRRRQPSERTLCGHLEASARGVRGWAPPYAPSGSVQNKVTDSTMAGRLSLSAAYGHACGTAFHAREHLNKHPQFGWQRERLRDVRSGAWTVFSARAS